MDRQAAVKLVRHKDRRLDLYNLYRNDRCAFLAYQNRQAHDIFRDTEYIVSFIGEDGLSARFVGVFEITGCESLKNNYVYEMKEVCGYDDLKERVIIRWTNTRSWHQWIKNEMEIMEISPGLNYKRFTDYFDLFLTFRELQEIVINQYTDWKSILSSIKGIYLITDVNTGKLYVGSAYGEEGVWGRWSEYVFTNGHGNNLSLRSLVEDVPDYAVRYFHFSILMLLSKTVTAEAAIEKERMFKKKLGTNAFGLNNN